MALSTLDTITTDTARELYRQGWTAFWAGDIRFTALTSFTRMREQAVALQDKRLEALAYNALSCVHDMLGQRKESLHEALTAERIALELGDQRLFAHALNGQAQYYKETGENTKAYELFARMQEIGHAIHDDELIMGSLIGMGRTTSMADVAKAIAYYEQAIELAESRGDQHALITCLNNLADWKINSGRYDEAIQLRERCLQISREIGDKHGVGRSLIGIGKAHTLLGNYDQAADFLNRGLPVVLGVGDLEGELHSFLNLAHLIVRNGDIPRGCEYYERVLDKSIAAPDHACAIFAQRALDLLAEGELPPPAILAPMILTPESVTANPILAYTYDTGDRAWIGNMLVYFN